jgi:hypothetical protein
VITVTELRAMSGLQIQSQPSAPGNAAPVAPVLVTPLADRGHVSPGKVVSTIQEHIEHAGKLVSFCGVIGTIEDIARPLGPFPMYSFLACLVVLGASFPAANLLAKLHFELPKVRSAAAIIGLISAGLLAYEGANPAAAQHGLLATKFPAAAEMQKALFGIERHLDAIEINTKKTVEKVDELRTAVKQETSSDPRKELANMGVRWDIESLNQAEESRDVQTMKLLLAGGMRPTTGSHSLESFVRYRFNEPIAQLYLSYKIADTCPLPSSLYFFEEVLKDEQKTRFLRNLCGDALRQPVETILAKQETLVRDIGSSNAASTASFENCVSQLKSRHTAASVNQAALASLNQAPISGSASKLNGNSPEGRFLFETDLRLMRGEYPLSVANVANDINKVCRQANPQRSDYDERRYLNVLRAMRQSIVR